MLDGAEPLGAGIQGIGPWLQAPEGLQCPRDALVFGNSGLMTLTGTVLCQDLGFRYSKKINEKPLPKVITGYCPQDEASFGGFGLSWEGVPMPEQRDEFGLSAS